MGRYPKLKKLASKKVDATITRTKSVQHGQSVRTGKTVRTRKRTGDLSNADLSWIKTNF